MSKFFGLAHEELDNVLAGQYLAVHTLGHKALWLWGAKVGAD